MLISIIIPVYNAENFLARCIDSVLNQSIKDFEIILINDGSVDKSSIICKKYCELDSRVKYFSQENQGVSNTRNRGINIAQGDYIIFLDNDDYMNINSFYYINNNIDKGYDIIFFQWKRTSNSNEGTGEICNEIVEFKSENSDDLIQQLLMPTDESLKNASLVFPWGKAYNRKFLLENRLEFNPEILLCEDVYFNIQALMKMKKALYIPSVEYFYFENKQSAGCSYKKNIIDIEENNYLKIKKLLQPMFKNLSIKQSYYYSVLYALWVCFFSNFNHIENKSSFKQKKQDIIRLRNSINFNEALNNFSLDGYKIMDKKQAIYTFLMKKKWYNLILLFSRVTIDLKRIKKFTINK